MFDDCSGDRVELGLGEYDKATLRKMDAGKRNINALKIVGDENCTVQLYGKDNYTGLTKTWKKFTSNFKDNKCHDLDKEAPALEGEVLSIRVSRSPPGVLRHEYFCTSQKILPTLSIVAMILLLLSVLYVVEKT